MFIGGCWALNDTQDTALLAGVVLDNSKSEWFYNLEFERHIGEDFSLQARVRLFNGTAGGQLQAFDREDYVELNLARYF